MRSSVRILYTMSSQPACPSRCGREIETMTGSPCFCRSPGSLRLGFAAVVLALICVHCLATMALAGPPVGHILRSHEESVQDKPVRGPFLVQAAPPDSKVGQAEAPPPGVKKPMEKEQRAEGPEQTPDQACLGCHGPDMLKVPRDRRAEQIIPDEEAVRRPVLPFRVPRPTLVIDAKKFSEGPHGGIACLDCHKGAEGHKLRLKSVDCKECHAESAEAVQVSAHGERPGAKGLDCLTCHDVHHGQGKEELVKEFDGRVCADCHKVYGMDVEKAHRQLYEPRMHLVMDCMLCHSGKEPGVHNIPAEKGKAAACESCHTAQTILSGKKEKPVTLLGSVGKIGFINDTALKKYGYVIGAHRIPALDALVLLAVIAPLALCLFHGTIRVFSRGKGPIHRPEETIYLHPLIERLWHWAQALCTIVLSVTGAMMHWPEQFPGWFQWAIATHNQFGIAAVIVFLVWLLYNLLTGRISHYIPNKRDIQGILKQIRFYAWGIFKHEPHPYAPTADEKFNPLQKLAYLQFQLFILPIVLASGLLYMYPDTLRGIIERIGGMALLGSVHFFLGGLFAAFLVAHIYLATTGETLGDYMKSMITGYLPQPRESGR